MKVLDAIMRLRPTTQPLPKVRDTSEILADVDQQVGRLTMVRDRALDIIQKIEDSEDAAE